MAKIRQYQDFTLDLRQYDAQTGRYVVAQVASAAWGEPPPVEVDLAADTLNAALSDLEAKNLYIDEQIELGKVLADRLLPAGAIRDNFVAAVKAAGTNEGVRLRLLIGDVALQQIPWEYTYLPIGPGPADRSHFLVLQPKVSLVRHPPMANPVPGLALSDPDQLRLLALLASPQAQGLPKLNLKAERRMLEKALGDFKVNGVTLTWKPVVEEATEADLDQQLAHKPDIFHFAGHGQFDEREQTGSLLLLKDKATQEPAYLPAAVVAAKLAAAGVRLAYLGACESSKVEEGRFGWTGVAPALIGAGVPAVLAMQYEIQDEMAAIFSEAYYVTLAAGLTVDEAVTMGRLAVFAKSTEKGVEWGVPTLYLRATDGVLFPAITQRNSATANGIRAAVEQVVGTVEQGGSLTGIQFNRVPGSGTFTVSQRVDVVRGTMTGIVIDEL